MSARDAPDAIKARLEAPRPYPESLLLDGPYADLAAMHAALEAVEEALEKVSTWRPYETHDIGEAFSADTVRDLVDDLRAAVEAALEPKGDRS